MCRSTNASADLDFDVFDALLSQSETREKTHVVHTEYQTESASQKKGSVIT